MKFNHPICTRIFNESAMLRPPIIEDDVRQRIIEYLANEKYYSFCIWSMDGIKAFCGLADDNGINLFQNLIFLIF